MNSSSPNVYAVHPPARYSKDKHRMVPFDLSEAEAFGELRFAFPGPDRPPPIAVAAPVIKEFMAGFRACDRLLIAGDLDLVVLAAMLGAKASGGKLTLLKWHSRDRAYFEVEVPNALLI